MIGGGLVSPPWAHPRGSKSRRRDSIPEVRGCWRGLAWVNGPHGNVGPPPPPRGATKADKGLLQYLRACSEASW